MECWSGGGLRMREDHVVEASERNSGDKKMVKKRWLHRHQRACVYI